MADPNQDEKKPLEEGFDLTDEELQAALTGGTGVLDFGDPNVDSQALEEARTEIEDLKDKLMRALADAENIRKRAERDRRDAELYGGTKLARDLVPVYDNMKRALETIDDDLREQAKGLVEGIELTQRELVSVFGKHQIVPINPEFGDKFDAQLHQAMFEAPVPTAPKGTVIQVMNEGFMIADRLIRPAQVGVSSTKMEAAPEATTEADPEA